MELIFLNVVLIIFPILMYLVFSCYNILINQKLEKIIFIITMCTSLYLCLNFNNSEILLLFCNIPILICYFKKESMFGILLSILVVIYSYYKFDVNMYVVISKYLVYFVTYFLLYRRREFNNLFFNIMAVIQGFFISFEYFMNSEYGFDKIINIIFYTVLIYLVVKVHFRFTSNPN